MTGASAGVMTEANLPNRNADGRGRRIAGVYDRYALTAGGRGGGGGRGRGFRGRHPSFRGDGIPVSGGWYPGFRGTASRFPRGWHPGFRGDGIPVSEGMASRFPGGWYPGFRGDGIPVSGGMASRFPGGWYPGFPERLERRYCYPPPAAIPAPGRAGFNRSNRRGGVVNLPGFTQWAKPR